MRALILLIIPIIMMNFAPTQHTQAEAQQWIEERKVEEWAKNYDGVGADGVPQCVDLVEYYYDYLVGYHSWGNADTYKDRILPNGWKYVDTPKPGDIAVWEATESQEYGHVAIVEKVWNKSKFFSCIEVNGLTGEFEYGGSFSKKPTTFIRPNWIKSKS